MKSELESKFEATKFETFKKAVLTEIETFLKEEKNISENDNSAINEIRRHLETKNLNGEIFREDLKLILRNIYGFFGRFFKPLPIRLEGLRNLPQFSKSALRRGDIQFQTPSLEILKIQDQLEKECAAKEEALREQKKLCEELRVQVDEQLLLLEKNLALKKELSLKSAALRLHENYANQLQKQCHELRALLLKTGVSIPPHLSVLTLPPSRTVSEADAHILSHIQPKIQHAGPTLFKLGKIQDSQIEKPEFLESMASETFELH